MKDGQSSGLSIGTLAVASASSLAAALVVSNVWGGGTLIGAAVTPVIVALVSEALRKPATVVSTVRQTRSSGAFDPVAEGRRGLREGDLPDAGSLPAGARTTVRVGRPRRPPRQRRRIAIAVATGLVAFAVAALLLTSSELVLGRSATSPKENTTLFGGSRSTRSDADEKTDTSTTDETTTTERTGTTPLPAGGTTTPEPSQTAPPTTTPTVPEAQQQEAPGPATPEPAPSSGTQAAPPGPADPATTTP